MFVYVVCDNEVTENDSQITNTVIIKFYNCNEKCSIDINTPSYIVVKSFIRLTQKLHGTLEVSPDESF